MKNIRRMVFHGMFVALTAALCITSCSKDDDEGSGGGSITAPSKKIKQIDLVGIDGHYGFTFEWDGDNLTKITETTPHFDGEKRFVRATFSYKNGRLEKARVYEDEDGEDYDDYTYTWDGDNRIKTEVAQQSWSDYYTTYTYTYTDGKPTRLKMVDSDDGYAEYVDIEWNGGNVVSYKNEENPGTIVYDNHPNPLHLPVGFEVSLVIVETGHIMWSANNVTSWASTDDNGRQMERTISYTYDEEGYPLTSTMKVEEGETYTGTYTYYE